MFSTAMEFGCSCHRSTAMEFGCSCKHACKGRNERKSCLAYLNATNITKNQDDNFM